LNGEVSPGHKLPYESAESGNDEIYVQPFPDSGGKTRVSTQGGPVTLGASWQGVLLLELYRRPPDVQESPGM
jgi:hypothetical protein